MKQGIRYAFLIALVLAAPGAVFAAGGKSGTTLAASKTLDICVQTDGNWRVFGEVSVWNEGVVGTSGFTLTDCIQNKTGTSFVDVSCVSQTGPEIPAGTTLVTATIFPYTFTLAPLTGDVRNVAKAKILNHSGSLGTPTGPEPKATWTGGTPAACPASCLCALSFGYWRNHTDAWPVGFDPNAIFYNSGKTWLEVLNTPPPRGNKYYILAHQYIAMVLNTAAGTCVTPGVQPDLDAARDFFLASTPDTCSAAGSCGPQNTWAGVFDSYIHGGFVSEGGPLHCAPDSDDTIGQ